LMLREIGRIVNTGAWRPLMILVVRCSLRLGPTFVHALKRSPAARQAA